MTIDVEIKGHFSVESDKKNATLIGFGGSGYGDYFKGEILPFAVDAQMTENDQTILSARYMLEGEDYLNKPCRMYISNVGSMDSMRPQIITDSKALAHMNEMTLSAKIESSEKGVIVRIYFEEEKDGII